MATLISKMDGSPGVTLINVADLNFNGQHEDDEEDIEEENMRKKMLKAQLEHAFDDCWNESEHEDSGNSSSSDEEARRPQQGMAHSLDKRLTGRGALDESREMLFRKLSSISERSPNKTEGGDNSAALGRYVFSPPRSAPYKFLQTNGGSIPPMDGRGDESPQPQQLSNNKVISDANGQFKPIFSTNSLSEKSQASVVENGDNFTAINGHAVENQPYQPIFGNNLAVENGEEFQYNTHSEQSHESIDETAEAYRQAEYNTVEQLRVLYEVRMREIKKLQADKVRAANHQQEMLRRLALVEAEKQRAVLSRTEASKLLVACKEEIGKLQKEVETQNQTITSLEKDKAKSDETAEMQTIHIQELEQRIELMERFDSNKTAAKHTEAVIKELKARQQQETKLMQKEVDSLSKKLSKKEEECRELERRVGEQQRAQEQLLVDKADTVNQLARRLEESQTQCSQLMTANTTVENARLQNQLGEALREKEQLSQTVANLQAECSIMRSDLTQYESLSRLTQPHHSSSNETDSMTQLGISNRGGRPSTSHSADMVAKLKDELHRALLNQKAKRSEIHRLQETIQNKEKEIREMTEQERIHLSEIETLKEQLNNMMMEIKSIRTQKETEKDPNDKSKSEEVLRLSAQVAELNKDKAVLEREKLEIKKKLDELTKQFDKEKKREISDHNKEYLKFHDEIVTKVRKQMEDEAELKIKEHSARLEQSLREVTEVKQLYVAVCGAKEEVARQLADTRAQLQQLVAERDQLTAELAESRKLSDRLAKSLNEATSPWGSGGDGGEGEGERERLRKELKEYVEMRDHLARRVNTAERENAKLAAEMDKLKTELEKRLLTTEENQGCAECPRLREELSGMSARHTHELTTARSELQAARDRLLQLERSARQQFDTEVRSLRQDRDQLRAKCDEKEAQIKKLIESRKRAPATVTVSCSSQTEPALADLGGERGGLEGVERRLREEYERDLAAAERAHEAAVEAARNRSRDEVERLRTQHEQLIEAEAQLRAGHQRELQAAEERTKQVTLEFCAAQIRRLEERYVEEASRRADPGVVAALRTALHERSGEVEKLKQMLAGLEEGHQKQLAALQLQMNSDRDKAAQMMVQWAQELKDTQGELKLKEAIVDEQRSQIEKARAKVQKLRNQLITTNEKMETEYTSKCNQYKAEFIKIVEEQEKTVKEKMKQLEEAYHKQVKELKKEMRKKKHST